MTRSQVLRLLKAGAIIKFGNGAYVYLIVGHRRIVEQAPAANTESLHRKPGTVSKRTTYWINVLSSNNEPYSFWITKTKFAPWLYRGWITSSNSPVGLTFEPAESWTIGAKPIDVFNDYVTVISPD